MITVVLIVLALAVFVMGFRFYGKFLTLGVFRLDHNAPTPASHRHDAQEFVRCPPGALTAHHIAGSTGLMTVVGIGVAAGWGWVPAYLWVVIGAVIGGGTLALGSLWLSLRYHGDTLPRIAREFLGWSGALPLYGLALMLLIGMAALSVLMIGRLLDTQSGAVWAFAALAPAAAALRQGAAASAPHAVFWGALAAAAWLGGGLTLGQLFPVVLGGGLTVSLGNDRIMSLGGELPWGLLALAMAAFSLKMPVAHTARPRGLIAAVLLAVSLSGMVIGLMVATPELAAPQFTGEGRPSVFAFLVLIVTGGALAGFVALLVTGPTARQLSRVRDAPAVAYGGSLTDALLGVIVVLLLSVSVGAADSWERVYPAWPDTVGLFRWLDLFVVRGAQFMAVLGLPLAWTDALVALALAALVLCGLETVLRTLGYVVEELGTAIGGSTLAAKSTRERSVVGGLVVVVIVFAQARLSVDHWLALGIAGQTFAIGAFLVIGLALLRIGRSLFLVAVPLTLVALGVLLGTGAALVDWAQEGRWALFAIGAVAAALGVWVAVATGREAARLKRQRSAGLPVQGTSLYSRYVPPSEP